MSTPSDRTKQNRDLDSVFRETIGQWQKHLLQLDRRNNLLYFKGKSSVPLLIADIDQFLVALSESRKGLQFLYAERRSRQIIAPDEADSSEDVYTVPGDIEADCPPLDLQRRLRKLRQKDREWEEEQGLNVLYLAVGFLNWIDEDGEVARSPILLVPCNLLRASPKDPFFLIRDEDDVTANLTLSHQLSQSGIILPDVSPDQSPTAYLASVANLVRKRPDWRVAPDVQLSTFQYSKMAMWEDLEQLKNEGVSHELVRALCGEPATQRSDDSTLSAMPFEKTERELAGGALDDEVSDRPLLVLPADYSQLQAVEAGRHGKHLLIHGPPGTGKSQTIANIIAALLADGKRVLFVSEKTAALDVVKRRLDQCGLSTFCLDLHSERGRKGNVYAQLRSSIEVDPHVPGENFDYPRLEERRRQLNAYVRALHERRQPLGRSVFQVQARAAVIRDAPDVRFTISDAPGLTEAILNDWLLLAARLSQREREFREHRTSLWLSLREDSRSVDLPDRIRHVAERLRSTLHAAESRVTEVSDWLGISSPTTCDEVEHLGDFAQHFVEAPGVQMSWLKIGEVQRLHMIAVEQSARQLERDELLNTVRPYLEIPLPQLQYADMCRRVPNVLDVEAKALALLGPFWSNRLATSPSAVAGALSALVSSADRVLGCGRAISETLEQAPTPNRTASLGDLQRVLQSAHLFLSLSPVPASWIDTPAGHLKAKIKEIEQITDSLNSAEGQLFSSYSEGLVDVVNDEMLVRYRTDHRRRLTRFLSGNYRRDRRMIRGYRRDAAETSVEPATADIELALSVKRLRAQLDAVRPDTTLLVGTRFTGKGTSWAKIYDEIDRLGAGVEGIEITSATRRLLVEGWSKEEVHRRASDLAEAVTEWDACWLDLNPVGTQENGDIDALRQAARDLGPIAAECDSVLTEARPHLHSGPESLAVLRAVLEAAGEITAIEEGLVASKDDLSRDFGNRFRDFDTNWSEISACLQWTERLLNLVGDRDSSAWSEHAVEPAQPEVYRKTKGDLEALLTSIVQASGQADQLFDVSKTDWEEWHDAPWVDIQKWCRELDERADEAIEWLQYRELIHQADAMSSNLVDQLRDITDDAKAFPKIIERRLLILWLDNICSQVPELRDFARRDHDAAIAEFRELDTKSTRAAARELQRRLVERYPNLSTTLSNAGELGTLRDQLSRRRGQLPVRRLFSRIPSLLQALKPCFMMSPLAVSQFLPRGAATGESLTFDVVVFDEASQIFPEDAVPSIIRADRAIVVGDEQQLPPTTFFRRAFDDDDEEVDDDNPDTNALAGRDSILDVMNGMLGRGVGESHLRVHYRSRHESLIRFSNHFYYGDRLLVFPSPDVADMGFGLYHVFLPEARYDAGATRTNQREAQEVVELVVNMMRSKPTDESIGVVALSRAQADLIEFLIEQRRIREPEIEFRFSESLTEPFFVKNLENVQGDERDHIILSIGYGPTVATGLVPNRFGPLNAPGGHRRLNVAVTRARRSLTVVHSLKSSDIRSDGTGARMLRRYLEYIDDPVTALEGAITGLDQSSEESGFFEQAVCDALTLRGHLVGKEIGVAGYRIDLAIMSEDGAHFDLGIECDGFTYHSSPAARDRDWLRQSILEQLGWRICRVWSTSWLRNPDAEISAIEEALARARSQAKIEPAHDQVPVPRIAMLAAAPTDISSPQERPHLFVTYQKASLAGLRRGPELQYETYPVLLPMLQCITDMEGPVHFDTIMERIREHYGMSRARKASRDQVWQALSRAVKERYFKIVESESMDDAFVRNADRPDAPPRQPAAIVERRNITAISMAELKAGLLVVARAAYGIAREELVRETARQFGYDRTGEDIAKRLGRAVKDLIKNRALVESFDTLRVSE